MISFVYRLTGSGWSEAIISDGANEASLNVSYLSDALRDLVTAVIQLLEGGKRAEFFWLDEPGEYQWLLTQREQTLSIRITHYRNWEQDRQPKDRAKKAFKTRCSLREFATAVLAQLTALYTTLGPKGYKERWVTHDFPLNEHRRLASLLSGEAVVGSSSG
jgi:hypothetical protein